MPNNFLIGVGGTGAKGIESFVHLCAAGLAPADMWLGLVDQDQNNGNLNRTKDLVLNYNTIRKHLRGRGGDSHNLSQTTGLLRTNITQPRAGLAWGPLQVESDSLAELYRYSCMRPELQDLMDGLYKGADERDLQLTEGFRGHPNIGAAAFLAHANAIAVGNAWTELVSEIQQSVGNSGSARVFFIGSIFGGTGAAGFPTLARLIRSSLNNLNIANRVTVGGALMLPYFTYRRSIQAIKDGEQRPAGDKFLDSSIAALQYYVQLFRNNSPFDHLYVLGWNPLLEIPDLGAGSANQANPPLLPELYAGLAASRFFTAAVHPPGKVFLIGRGADKHLQWEDVPKVNDNLGYHDVKHGMGQMLRFAFAWHYIYAPFLVNSATTDISWHSCQYETWFRRLITKHAVDMNNDGNQQLLRELQKFCEKHLTWAASLTNSSVQPGITEPRLFMADALAWPQQDGAKLTWKTYSELPEKDRHDFAKLIYTAHGLSLEEVYWELTYAQPHPDHRSLGISIGLLYDLCAPNTKKATR